MTHHRRTALASTAAGLTLVSIAVFLHVFLCEWGDCSVRRPTQMLLARVGPVGLFVRPAGAYSREGMLAVGVWIPVVLLTWAAWLTLSSGRDPFSRGRLRSMNNAGLRRLVGGRRAARRVRRAAAARRTEGVSRARSRSRQRVSARRNRPAAASTLAAAAGTWQPACMLRLDLHPPYTLERIRAAFRRHSKRLHPDQGGDVRQFISLRESYEEALGYAEPGPERSATGR